ncbi:MULTISPECIES: hypothetical protein [Actinoplanes]|uniref:Secreted protein n=1 Tax=Actinoplanes palleronii TaxID=113570 RepID=A0ABQ4BE23_9ACTN|nr:MULTISPECIES: hypothetical protein [Actinoplanes]GIE68946.1 hypothetical protein Apa02nite_050540 [Actinoplanes palleronii]
MRRTVLYPAGLMIAAGASLALAGPASAAPSASARNCCSYSHQGPSNQGRSFAPYRQSQQFAPRGGGLNLQNLVQISVTNQIVLNNVGNTQIGAGNYNGGGSVNLSSFTSQFGGIFGGR